MWRWFKPKSKRTQTNTKRFNKWLHNNTATQDTVQRESCKKEREEELRPWAREVRYNVRYMRRGPYLKSDCLARWGFFFAKKAANSLPVLAYESWADGSVALRLFFTSRYSISRTWTTHMSTRLKEKQENHHRVNKYIFALSWWESFFVFSHILKV